MVTQGCPQMVTTTQKCPHSDIQVPPWSTGDNGDTGMFPNGDSDIRVPLWPIGGRDDTGMSPNADNDIQVPLRSLRDSNGETGMSPKGDDDSQMSPQ